MEVPLIKVLGCIVAQVRNQNGQSKQNGKGFGNLHFVYGVNHLPKMYTIARAVGNKCKTSVSTRQICVFIVLRISPVEMQRTTSKLHLKLRCMEYDEESASPHYE